MANHHFQNRAEAESFLRAQGFQSWETAPDYWHKSDGLTNLYGDLEEDADGAVLVVIDPGAAFAEIEVRRQRRNERNTLQASWDDDGGAQNPPCPVRRDRWSDIHLHGHLRGAS